VAKQSIILCTQLIGLALDVLNQKHANVAKLNLVGALLVLPMVFFVIKTLIVVRVFALEMYV